MLNSSILLQCLTSHKCNRRSQSCGRHLFLPKATPLPPLLSLPSHYGGVAKKYVDVPLVEHAVEVKLCPQNDATWRACPRLRSKACKACPC